MFLASASTFSSSVGSNKLRIGGVEKRAALVGTGKTRMRPILMTALTTILSMSVMVFSQDAGNAMQQGMAIVVCFGLIYSTFMTLYIVPIMYDILYRKQPKDIDTGSDDATVGLANLHGARVLYRKWDNDFSAQRNFFLFIFLSIISFHNLLYETAIITSSSTEIFTMSKPKINNTILS